MTFQKLLEPQRGREEMEASGGPGLRGHRQEAQGTGESEMGQGGMGEPRCKEIKKASYSLLTSH